MFKEFFKSMPRFFCWLLVFSLTQTVRFFDRIAGKILRHEKRTEWLRRGSCARTGQCCRDLAIEIPRSWARRPRVVRAMQAWYRYIYRFEPTGVVNGNWLQFSCGNLTGENTCSVYPYRPNLCRDYPAVSLFGHAKVHKGCGFWFVKKSEAGGFAEKLLEEEHAAERETYRHPSKL